MDRDPGTPTSTPRQDAGREPSHRRRPLRTLQDARKHRLAGDPAGWIHRARRMRAAQQRAVCRPTRSATPWPSCGATCPAAPTLVISEYRGLTVKEIAEIRRALRKQNVTYRVVKNRLMRIAAEQEGNPGVAPLLRGPSRDRLRDRATRRLVAKDGPRGRPTLQAREGHGRRRGRRRPSMPTGVTRLATLPSRDVLLAQLGGAFAAPGHAGRRAAVREPAQPRPCARPAAGAEGAAPRPERSEPVRKPARPPRATIARSHESHGHPHPGRAARRDRRHDRSSSSPTSSRSSRTKFGVTAAAPVAGRRRRRPPPPRPSRSPRSRPSSPPSSPRSARTRSRSSRSCAS